MREIGRLPMSFYKIEKMKSKKHNEQKQLEIEKIVAEKAAEKAVKKARKRANDQ